MDIQKVQDLKREQRRKRRLRNKFLSVLTVVLFAVLIAFLGVFIYMKLDEMQKAKTHNDDVSDKLEELTGDETDIPVISEPDVEVVVPETDPFEDALKAMIAEMTVEEKETKELQKREMLEDYQIRDMAYDMYEKNDNQIMIMYSSGELGINAIEYRKLQREIESLRRSKESKRKIEENAEKENEEPDRRNAVFANPREYQKFDIWEIAPLIALIIGLELLLVLYRPFEDEMLYK